MILFLGHILSETAEGSYQRVRSIDQIAKGLERTYIKWDNRSFLTLWGRRQVIDPLCVQVSLSSRNPLHWLYFFYLLMAASSVYVHSVYAAASLIARRLLPLAASKLIWDVHGLVPEELRLLEQESLVPYYSSLEYLCARSAAAIVVVSREMERHLKAKFSFLAGCRVLYIPILPPLPEYDIASKHKHIVYSGGNQPWQLPEQIIDVMSSPASAVFTREIFTPETDWFKSRLPADSRSIAILKLSSAELFAKYREAGFGVILRDDHIINRAACPTKLSEYLYFGLIPIVKSKSLGDFESLGFETISAKDAMAGEWPDDQRAELMRAKNRAVIEKLKLSQSEGFQQLKELLQKPT